MEQGLEQGKEIYAVPGQITDHLSMGCNQLIQQGAGILTSPDDIFDYFQIGKKLRLREKIRMGLPRMKKWCIVAWISTRNILIRWWKKVVCH